MKFTSKLRNNLAGVLSAVLVTSAAATPVVQASESDVSVQGPLSLAEVMYYDSGADEIRLIENQIDYDRVTKAEVDQIKSGLTDLSDEQIDQVLAENGYDPAEMRQSNNSGTSFRIAPAVIWGGVAILGILTGGGLIFYATYTSHEEKQNLVNKCYENGGTPVVDSRDSTGVEGSPDSGAAQKEGGYRFECQKS